MRHSGMQCALAGLPCVLSIKSGKQRHPADGARVKIVTNRYSMILVEMLENHGIYSKGSQLHVAPQECVSQKSVDQMEMMISKAFSTN